MSPRISGTFSQYYGVGTREFSVDRQCHSFLLWPFRWPAVLSFSPWGLFHNTLHNGSRFFLRRHKVHSAQYIYSYSRVNTLCRSSLHTAILLKPMKISTKLMGPACLSLAIYSLKIYIGNSVMDSAPRNGLICFCWTCSHFAMDAANTLLCCTMYVRVLRRCSSAQTHSICAD